MQSNPEETWTHVVGFEGLYEVSDQGRVRSLARTVKRGESTLAVKPKMKALYPDVSGYWRVTLYKKNKAHGSLVHRLVALAFIGPGAEGQEVCHIDGDPSNAALGNLRWDSHSSNELDKAEHGTQYNLLKESCPRGHQYAGENLYINPRGSRECRTCRQERVSKFKAARRALRSEQVAA